MAKHAFSLYLYTLNQEKDIRTYIKRVANSEILSPELTRAIIQFYPIGSRFEPMALKYAIQIFSGTLKS